MTRTPHALALMLACLGLAATAQADPNQGRNLAATCANCHGTNGRAQEGGFNLAGQDKDEMLKKLIAYKKGERPATIMHQLAKGYTDEQLAQISAYFAAQKP